MADIDRGTSRSGVPFDPYNFSEIEKIQLDIERDLSVIGKLTKKLLLPRPPMNPWIQPISTSP